MRWLLRFTKYSLPQIPPPPPPKQKQKIKKACPQGSIIIDKEGLVCGLHLQVIAYCMTNRYNLFQVNASYVICVVMMFVCQLYLQGKLVFVHVWLSAMHKHVASSFFTQIVGCSKDIVLVSYFIYILRCCTQMVS